MRINKYLKEKGYTTRRGADELILSGSVFVNGKKAILGIDVSPKDVVEIKKESGVGVKDQMLYYIAYNKPIGILTNKDNVKGKDILANATFTNEDNKRIRVFPVGRLDKDSYGLIIMTNDGRVTDKLLSPRFLHEKEYIVTTDKPFNDFFLKKLEMGVRIDGMVTRKAKTQRISDNSFYIILTEGKKRQIRRMCEALHLQVVDLCRVRIMNIHLGKLKPNEWRHLNEKEKKEFLNSLYIQEKKTIPMVVFSKAKLNKKVVKKPIPETPVKTNTRPTTSKPTRRVITKKK